MAGKGGTGFATTRAGPIKTLSNSGAIRSGSGDVGAGASFSGVGGGGGDGVSNVGTITSLSNIGAIRGGLAASATVWEALAARECRTLGRSNG